MAGYGQDQVVTSKYHTSYKEFLSPRECDIICHALDTWEDYVLDLPSPNSEYTGLTAKFTVINWLAHPDIARIDIPHKLFNLPEFKDLPYLIIQCWGNILRHDRGLDTHTHEGSSDSHFHNGNIFLKGEYNTTHYPHGEETNEAGQIAIFSSDLEHSVPKNPYETPRYSMALDIYPTYGLCALHNGHPLNLRRFRCFRNNA